jgi:signal peptidase I
MTALVVTILLSLLMLWLIVAVSLLWLGLRWVRVPDVSMMRATGVIVVSCIVQQIIQFPLAYSATKINTDSQPILLFWLLLAIINVIVTPCAIIKYAFKTSVWQSFRAWLTSILAIPIMIAFVLLIFRPFVLEAFASPTNGMAPTILGATQRSSCPTCGQTNYCTPLEVDRYVMRGGVSMICKNFHVHEQSDIPNTVYDPDRILTLKFLSPERWDIAIFESPDQPDTLYVMRVVGLPGELIEIKDGAVWVNGKQLEVPSHLDGLKYVTKIDNYSTAMWGTEAVPAQLANDEFFVLGDFSMRARDSRIWQEGAPGHAPYAVPKSHIKGVATHIYWPFSRWRALR